MPKSHHEYPVVFDVERPVTYDRAQIALRLLILVLLGALSTPLGWLFGVLYLALPAIAAIGVSSRGSARYLSEFSPAMVRVLRWVVSFYAYLILLTDRFPQFGSPESLARFEVHYTDAPTVGSALKRLFTTLPYAAVLLVLGVAGSLVWLVSLVAVLVNCQVPIGLYDFLRGTMRWQARLFAYHASLVDEYPPWSFDADPMIDPASPGSR